MLTLIQRSVLVVLLCAGLGLCAHEAPGEREAKALAVLKSNAEVLQKTDACRELALVGTAEAVPALAALLSDEKLSGAARFGLEQIGGTAVDEALRTALGNLKGTQQVGVIDSLGARRDSKAVDALAGLLKDADAQVAQAAARALGTIGTEEAAKGLGAALAGAQGANQMAVCEGLFRCAEAASARGQADKAIAIYDSVRALAQMPHQVRTAAWRGTILMRKNEGLPLLMEAAHSGNPGLVMAAARIALEADSGVAKLLSEELGKMPPERQVLFAGVLGQRGDAAALPALLSLAKAGDKTARVAALKAASEIGDVSAAATMLELLKDPEAAVAQAAGAGLAGLRGADVDDAVIKALGTSDQGLRPKLLEIVGKRRMMTALPVLSQMMDAADEGVRLPAITTYGELAGMPELPGLLAKLAANTRASEIAALEKAIGAICSSAENPSACVPELVAALGKAAPEAKPALLRTLRVAGGADALKAVRAAVDDGNKEVHAAAVRVLSEWKSAEAVPVLLELAKSAAEPVDRILALRGCLGMAAQREIAAEARLALCREAAPLIQRPEEKRLLLAAVSSLAAPQALDLIVPYLEDAGVKQEAILAILSIAEKRAKKQYVSETKAALEKVLKSAPDNAAAKRAEKLLTQLAGEQ
ncbi:MAG: HEAT repeat domain-containing protein [Planctomycetota bacterium]